LPEKNKEEVENIINRERGTTTVDFEESNGFIGNFAGVLGGLGENQEKLLPIILVLVAGIIIYFMNKKKDISEVADDSDKNDDKYGDKDNSSKKDKKGKQELSSNTSHSQSTIMLPSKGHSKDQKESQKQDDSKNIQKDSQKEMSKYNQKEMLKKIKKELLKKSDNIKNS